MHIQGVISQDWHMPGIWHLFYTYEDFFICQVLTSSSDRFALAAMLEMSVPVEIRCEQNFKIFFSSVRVNASLFIAYHDCNWWTLMLVHFWMLNFISHFSNHCASLSSILLVTHGHGDSSLWHFAWNVLIHRFFKSTSELPQVVFDSVSFRHWFEESWRKSWHIGVHALIVRFVVKVYSAWMLSSIFWFYMDASCNCILVADAWNHWYCRYHLRLVCKD